MPKTALIDLATTTISVIETPANLLRQFLGGRGLGAKLLYDHVGLDVDPLLPENYLIFTAAPLVNLSEYKRGENESQTIC